jgi:oligopeptide transport system substrate-binding protein
MTGRELAGQRWPRAGRPLALVLAAVLGMVAAGCSSSGPSASSSAVEPPPSGVLRLGVEAPATLDPTQARAPSEFLLADQLFEGLTTYDNASVTVKPAIASGWKSSADQKQWDFTLRPDAKFTNGRPITSTDVKYTFERIARKGSTSPVVPQLEAIAGFKPFNLTGKAADLAGVAAPAPNVVHFQLDEPISVLPAVLANPAFGIVARESVEAVPPAPTFASQPVGSGPFMVQARNESSLHLVPSPGTHTSLKSIEVFLAKDSASAYADFLRGGVDWAEAPSDQVEAVPEAKGKDRFSPYAADLLYGFNMKNPKFADQRFREAITHAIDHDAIVRVVYGSAALSAHGLVPEGIPGALPDACGDRCRFDPVKAKGLIKDVFGDKPPPEVKIDYDDNPSQSAVAEAMQANLRAVGVTATPRPHAYAEYLGFALSGQQELFRLGAIGTYPSPDAFLTPLFLSGGSSNVTGFVNPQIDALLKQARTEPDDGKRLAAYQQAEKLVLEQAPVVPIAQFQTHAVTGPRVSGLNVSVFGTFDATQVRLND